MRPKSFSKDRWYWVRYKYGSTVTPAQPLEIRDGRVVKWGLPWMNRAVERDDEVAVVGLIPFPRDPLHAQEPLPAVDSVGCDWCDETLLPEEGMTRLFGKELYRFHPACAARVDAMGQLIKNAVRDEVEAT